MKLLDLNQIALFLDFDGTLVEFAETPEGVDVPEVLRETLLELNEQLGGALAVVSGRSLESLDSLLQLPQLSAAGGHGAEWRLGEGEVHSAQQVDTTVLAKVRKKLEALTSQEGLLLEDKGHSLALHFRKRPDLEGTLDEFIATEVVPLDGVRVIAGNCVREVQARGVDKGLAVARFMQMEPFAQRTPCYIGDDTTDEDAFAWINQQSGVSIKVGASPTVAELRLAGVSEVHEFLQRSLSRGSE